MCQIKLSILCGKLVMAFSPPKNLFIAERSRNQVHARLVVIGQKLRCMCSVFATVEQRHGRKANLLCPASFKNHGASWTRSVDFERAGWANKGCWRGGFRSAGVYGRAEMSSGSEANVNLAG